MACDFLSLPGFTIFSIKLRFPNRSILAKDKASGTSNISIGGNFLTITKEALSEESKWKGEDSEQFRFPIISVWVRYNAPSEVYGVKEQERHERFLFNKNGELLIVIPEVISEQKKEHYNKLLAEALKNVKL